MSGPVPYNYGQIFAPKTAVGVIEETHIFSPHLINQFKWGYARYNGPTFQPNQTPVYAAATQGITGLPAGQAAGAFPIVTFAGTNALQTGPVRVPTSLLPKTTPCSTTYSGMSASTPLHSVVKLLGCSTTSHQTPGAQAHSPSPVPLRRHRRSTYHPSHQAPPTQLPLTPVYAYASFFVGQIDKGSLTQNLVQQYNSRFRAISPYVQDNWKVNEKLTLDLGLRWDYFPTLVDAHDNMSFFSPNLANPITATNGALEFTGTGANTCNCRTPV